MEQWLRMGKVEFLLPRSAVLLGNLLFIVTNLIIIHVTSILEEFTASAYPPSIYYTGVQQPNLSRKCGICLD